MNHEMVTIEALRYRFSMIRGALVTDSDLDLEAMARATVAAADPTVDGALRRIATAWARAGLDPNHLCLPWDSQRVHTLFTEHPELIDALDDIVSVATNVQAA